MLSSLACAVVSALASLLPTEAELAATFAERQASLDLLLSPKG